MIRAIWRRFSKWLSRTRARRMGVRFGRDCELLSLHFGSEPYLVSLGDRVKITGGVRFITHDGAVYVLRNIYPECRNADIIRPITVGSNVFIGVDTVILPGSVIGDNTVIGAGSVVSGTFPPNVVIAGVPAKVICGLEDYLGRHRAELRETKGLSGSEKRSVLLSEFGEGEGRTP